MEVNQQANRSIDILLIQPQLGSFDNIIRDIPLSLIYAATDSVKSGCRVRILDLRLRPDHWEEQVDSSLSSGCSLVGLSVMTGNPIRTALAVSRYVKEKYALPIVWGGPHPTILPEQTLQNPWIDYVVRDYGSKALWQLIKYLKGEQSVLSDILGLGYKREGKIILNPVQTAFEMLDYRDLPYDLVEIQGASYNRLGELVLPIYTAMGCPYQCSFCMSPEVYKKIKGKKVVYYSNESVLNHIDYLLGKFNFQRLQIYDDDSFTDVSRLTALLNGYVERGFHRRMRLDFRGARVNELDKVDDAFLHLMVAARVEILAIGAESGSDATLERMNKGITAEQTIRVNQKLAKYSSLRPHYNFFCGVPGDTMEDMILTKRLLLQLVRDNPNCYLGVGADWKPLPGTAMTELAVREYGLQLPLNLEGWAAIDSFDAIKIVHPWYTKRMDNMIKLLSVAGWLLDRKVRDFRRDFGLAGLVFFLLWFLYRPILWFRLKCDFASCMMEYDLKSWLIRFLGRRQGARNTIE